MSDFAADIAYSFSVSEMLDLIANPPSWYGVDEEGKPTTGFLIEEDLVGEYETYLNVKLAEPPTIHRHWPSGLILTMELTYEEADPVSHQEWRALNEEDK